MPTFAIRKIKGLSAATNIRQFCIDGIAVLDEFEKSLAGIPEYESELRTIFKYRDFLGAGNKLPINKYRHLNSNARDKIVAFEFKSKHLRVYGIIEKDGRLIMLCGQKKDQDKDLRQLRSRKKLYLNNKG